MGLSARASSLDGKSFTATLKYNGATFGSPITGVVGSGFEITESTYGWLYLDLNQTSATISSDSVGMFVPDVLTIIVTFPTLLAEQFTAATGHSLYHNSAWGWSSLAVTGKNQLTFSYGGDHRIYNYYYQYLWSQDQWGYGLEKNPDYREPKPNGGGSGNRVPDSVPSLLALGGALAVLLRMKRA
ncbi:hypothetical protein [Nibricoccus sp. IMCC34717]|uniref:hypothetical protein n=1 Tax=Nibricoccus sp. IMCC34717 TaxID=3034021 RepID=UPI00384A7DDB